MNLLTSWTTRRFSRVSHQRHPQICYNFRNFTQNWNYCCPKWLWIANHKLYLTLKMEAARPSETLVSYHITTWCHNPEHRHFSQINRIISHITLYDTDLLLSVKLGNVCALLCSDYVLPKMFHNSPSSLENHICNVRRNVIKCKNSKNSASRLTRVKYVCVCVCVCVYIY